MNNNIEKRVRQQKKPSHLSSQPTTPLSPPLSPLDENTLAIAQGNKNSGIEDGLGKTNATNDKRRNTWVESAKRKLTPRSAAVDGPTTADPFAGMKTCINYQQEIERLKTLVPKVEIKKRPLSTSSSSSASSSTCHRLAALPSTSTTNAVTSPTISTITPPSSSSSSQVSSSSSTASSCDSLSSTSASPTHQDPVDNSATIDSNDKDRLRQSSTTSVITDEEKARFLEFMRSWTGGLNGWNEQPMEQPKGWMWNHQQPTRRSQSMTRSEPTTPLQEIYPDPWYHQQQPFIHQHPTNDLYPKRLSSPPQSALPLSSYQQQPLYFASMQQQQRQSSFYPSSPHNYNQHSASPMDRHTTSSQIGTIGDRHRPTRHHGPFGVSVM